MSASSPSAVASERVNSPFQNLDRAAPGAAVAAPVAAALAPTAAVPAPLALTLRSMTGYEEEYLEAAASESNTARLCNGLLARCAVPVGEVSTEALAAVRGLRIADRDRALLELRRKSLGDKVETAVDCPACSAANEVDFDLTSLLTEDETGEEPIAVDLGGRRAVLRLPTAGDQEALIDSPCGSAAERRSRLLARLLLQLGDESGPFSEEVVHALPTADRRALERAVDTAAPDVPLDMVVDCCECGCQFTSPFDVAVFFCLR